MSWTGILQTWGSFKSTVWKLVDEEKNNIALSVIVLVSFVTFLPGFDLKNRINEVPRTLTSQHFVVFPHAVSLCSFWAWTLTCALSDSCGREFFVFNTCMAVYELVLIVAYAFFTTSQEDREKAFTWCLWIGIAMIFLIAIFFSFDSSGVTNVMQFIAAFVGIIATISPLIAHVIPYGGWLGNVADSRVFVGGKASKISLFIAPITALLWVLYASKDPIATGLEVQAFFGLFFGAAQLYIACFVMGLSAVP